MSTAADPVAVGEKPLSEGERIIDTFIAPSKTFIDIRRNASWWAPFLLIAAFWVGLAFVADAKIGMEAEFNNELRLTPKQADRLEQMPAEQHAEQLQAAVKRTRVFWLYMAPGFALGLGALVAAISMGTFNFGFGAKLKFNQCMALFMYPSLPLIIKTSLAMLILLAGAGEAFMFQDPVASNLGILVDPKSSLFLHFILRAIDVFAIWTLILAGIGYSYVTGLKRNTCLAVVFVWWAIMTLVLSGLGAAVA